MTLSIVTLVGGRKTSNTSIKGGRHQCWVAGAEGDVRHDVAVDGESLHLAPELPGVVDVDLPLLAPRRQEPHAGTGDGPFCSTL